MRDEITQKEDLRNGRRARGLESIQFNQMRTVREIESKQFTQTNGEFKSTQSEPAGVCWKSENRFEILKDDDDVIDWHIWCDNVTSTFVVVILNHRNKYRRAYYFRFR